MSQPTPAPSERPHDVLLLGVDKPVRCGGPVASGTVPEAGRDALPLDTSCDQKGDSPRLPCATRRSNRHTRRDNERRELT